MSDDKKQPETPKPLPAWAAGKGFGRTMVETPYEVWEAYARDELGIVVRSKT